MKLMNLKILKMNILFSAESKSFEWVLSKKIDYAFWLEVKSFSVVRMITQ